MKMVTTKCSLGAFIYELQRMGKIITCNLPYLLFMYIFLLINYLLLNKKSAFPTYLGTRMY